MQNKLMEEQRWYRWFRSSVCQLPCQHATVKNSFYGNCILCW